MESRRWMRPGRNQEPGSWPRLLREGNDMPMPMPGPSEDKEQFVDRCMGDETMNEDVSDPAQRRGVCETQWDERGEHAMKYGHIVPAVFGIADILVHGFVPH